MWLSKHSGYLGIMICETNEELPFTERPFYRRLILAGEQCGLSVYVFSPLRINWETQSVAGYTYTAHSRRWSRKSFPLPHLIYDRCFYRSKTVFIEHQRLINRLKQSQDRLFIGNGLKGKWHVQQALLEDPELQRFLPYTSKLKSMKTLDTWLEKRGEVFLKPQAGCQGKGALHVQHVRHDQHSLHTNKPCYIVKGRDRKNRLIQISFEHRFALFHWIRHFVRRRPYIAQHYLSLMTTSGDPFDVRSLMQKNGAGVWQLTGMAIRKGSPGSITSNLHGGGQAEEVIPFLQEQFGVGKAEELLSCMCDLSMKIPHVLEQSYGRLIELGIDFGIDQMGNIWILEVNSKPGRSVFIRLNNKRARHSSIHNPIRYARYLLDRQLGG